MAVLGVETVTRVPNITKYDSSNLIQIKVSSLRQLQEVISNCAQRKQAVYPVSTGFNWGLGSRIPVMAHSTVIDLSAMNRIIDYDAQQGVVVIEPGVTQEQLATFLQGNNSGFYVDVTGSSQETSIVGNALERGISYNGQRSDQIIGLEVLTGNGELLRTGSMRFAGSKLQHIYKSGIGPDLTHLFVQSNFGIVTKMAYRLRPKIKYYCFVKINFNHTVKVIDSLPGFSELMSQKVVTSVFHFANPERAKGVLIPYLEALLKEKNLSFRAKDLSWFIGKENSAAWTATGILEGFSKQDLANKKNGLTIQAQILWQSATDKPMAIKAVEVPLSSFAPEKNGKYHANS